MRNNTQPTAQELAEKFRTLSDDQQKAAYAFLWGYIAQSDECSHACEKAMDYARRTFE